MSNIVKNNFLANMIFIGMFDVGSCSELAKKLHITHERNLGISFFRYIVEQLFLISSQKKNLLRSDKFSSAFLQCFFPENLVNEIETPFFLLNAAYDTWQVSTNYKLILLWMVWMVRLTIT